MFKKFWELYEAVSDFNTPDGWVEGFSFGKEMNAAALEIMAYENSLNSIDEDEEDREIDEMRERVRWTDLEDEDEEEFPASTLSRLRKQRGKESIMNAQLNDTHYTVIAAIHEQMPSHLFMSSGDYNTPTLMWYTDRAGGKEEHSLRFDSYAAQRAFISALESEGYFAQSSVTGLMFRRDSMRIPASIYKPKQDDREIRQNAQIHANLAISRDIEQWNR